MDLREAFVQSIAETPYDDAPRLIFADWLEDNGDVDRAEFIRIQCELEPMRDRYEIDRATWLHSREETLLVEHKNGWLGEMPTGWDEWRTGVSVEFRRGFVDTLMIPAWCFFDLGTAILRSYPTVRRLVLFRVNGYGERLAACPALGSVPELELACWYSDADAEAIAVSPHLNRLQILELWLGRWPELTDERLCRIMAESKAWPRLRELTLLNPDDENEGRGKELLATADEVAGRGIAVYRRGWPDRFPFAADFWYTFPGYLPDGRMAMAAENHHSSPPSLSVLTFDGEGNQTE